MFTVLESEIQWLDYCLRATGNRRPGSHPSQYPCLVDHVYFDSQDPKVGRAVAFTFVYVGDAVRLLKVSDPAGMIGQLWACGQLAASQIVAQSRDLAIRNAQPGE